MRTKRTDNFTTITVEGQILPADLLQRIIDKDSELGGLTPDCYHLVPGENVNEATSRAWNKLIAAWATFKAARDKLPPNDPGTTVTRERWLLPLFQELGYGRLPSARAVNIEGKSYAISHWWANVPLHLVGSGVSVDRLSARVAGAARSSPHSLVQELLNRSEEYLWGFVSNGLQLRILRDNQTLVRQSYVEFDLEAMMDGEAYSDFVMLWLLCHQSRVEAERPTEYWLEKWSRAAQERGVRALEHLREGVEDAISLLGSGFLAHPRNSNLREKLRSGQLDKQDYYRQLLRLVYRLLFLFVAEDRTDEKGRSLIFDPTASQEACERYSKFYSTKKLRTLAERRHGSRHSDLYTALRLVMQKLGSDNGCRELGLPALGSFLFSTDAIADLNECELANHDLLDGIRALAFATENQARRQVDYKNLGSEELGSVYESLLELHPQLNVDAASFALSTAAGHERKTTGSYYTHDSLVQSLVDSALEPVLADRENSYAEQGFKSKEEAVLSLKVCDPACGSGHFLIAAAHRIAKHLAAIRTGDDEPSPEAIRRALRDVVGRCLYGVDINPMAVELCKVSLWMEALEPGKPLSFLDHHILCGNSLLGTTPALIKKGIPDEAFRPIEGDDRKLCAEYKKQNKRERQQETLRGFHGDPWEQLGNLAASLASIEHIADDTIEGVRQRQQRYANLVNSSGYRYGGLLADAWCAAFVWRKQKSTELPYPITEEVFRKIEVNPFEAPNWMENEIKRLASRYQFFHWHLAFPGVFHLPVQGESVENENNGWNGGFDVVLGNPPWERIQVEVEQFFSSRRPDLLDLKRSERQKLIDRLQQDDPPLFHEWIQQRRFDLTTTAFLKSSNRFPLSTQKNVNSYAVFLELSLGIVAATGRCGLILQSGVATDEIMKPLFQFLIRSRNLVSFYDFVNTEGLFPHIHRTHPHFCLLTTASKDEPRLPDFSFWNTNPVHLLESDRHFTLSADDIALLNPNTLTCPIFRSKREAEITKAIYRVIPVLWRDVALAENRWQPTIRRMFDMAYDSHLFSEKDELTERSLGLDEFKEFCGEEGKWVRLYESKLMHQFDHRFASYDSAHQTVDVSNSQKQSPTFVVQPRYWVTEYDYNRKMEATRWNYKWIVAFREITNTTNERTAIAAILPVAGVGHTCYTLTFDSVTPQEVACFVSNANSFCYDWITRQKLAGTHLSAFILKQLATLPPETYRGACPWGPSQTLTEWIFHRVLELTFTAWDLSAFAVDCGWEGPPFQWNEDRRLIISCELDAANFHLYGIERNDAAYILETFPIVKRKDEHQYGEYRTRRLILEMYDEMASAIRARAAYQTRLDPPPADPRVAHPPRVQPRPLALPSVPRYPQPDAGVYMMRVILSMLQDNYGSIDVERLMSTCELLAMPDRLETYGSAIEPNLAHAWRSSFNDQFRPDLFLPKIDDLVQRGEIKLIRENGRFTVVRIGTAALPADAHIDFDARFALQVNDSLSQTEKATFTPLATREQIEERSQAA